MTVLWNMRAEDTGRLRGALHPLEPASPSSWAVADRRGRAQSLRHAFSLTRATPGFHSYWWCPGKDNLHWLSESQEKPGVLLASLAFAVSTPFIHLRSPNCLESQHRHCPVP
ncbi:unnamed protein product [Rangifer tarandus platyrhynchus]|uniref:Uncharacterized protein n=2 Tax=Rangifer tarandus platyrhynchus TaxID=3082113 RepID=A0ABN8Y2R9_RANTA|nr:unnamed protein product [Rangifer tarandus platyrhynchus]